LATKSGAQIVFIVETPIPKVKSGACRAKRSGFGKLNNTAKRRVFIPVITDSSLAFSQGLAFVCYTLSSTFGSRLI
jgi:hypothetical protein